MQYFVFRNFTIEPFFKDPNFTFSGYEDISIIDKNADKYIWCYFLPYKINNDIIAKEITTYGNLLDLTLSRLDASKEIVIFTISPIFEITYQTLDTGIKYSIAEYNRKIYQLARENGNIKIIDIDSFYNHVSRRQLIDWKYYYISQIPINPKLASVFNQWFLRQLEITEMKRKKCIVVDLDNTLWAGILGEDGIDGIKMGEDYPGSAYRFFQEYLLELSHMGIILAICSKNNEVDVLDVWEKHPDMLIRKDAVVTYRINWLNKADNIQDIARELNIGLDSIVFVDDNPTERELVKQMLPDVCVPDFPIHPYLYPEFITYLTDNYFSTYTLTQEDLLKTEQYKENNQRRQYKEQFTDITAYLHSLEIKLTVEKLSSFNRVRFAQMTQKTNQFNLTTHRYTETDIQDLSDKGGWVYGLRVKDKFGDNGLTGLIIITIDGQTASIDTFLLSCRILGKEIEYAFLKYMLEKLKSAGIAQLKAAYIKTSKNEQVKSFFDRFGFQVKKYSEDYKKYELILNQTDFIPSDIYILEEA
jgi:FkbH-like protein